MTSAIFLLLAARASVDVKVEGEGYFRFAREGRPVYAKTAKLVVERGRLCSAEGPYVVPEMLVPGAPDALRVTLSGDVYAHYTQGESKVGRIILVQFGQDVRPVESKGFLICSGQGEVGEAGQGLFGVIRSGLPTTEKTAEPEANPEIKIYADDGQPVVQVTPTKPADLSFLKAGGVKVTLYDDVVVDGDAVLLGDVASVSANADAAAKIAALQVGATPLLGVTTSVSRSEIERALVKAGIESKNLSMDGPSQVRIKRAYQEIDQDNFVKAAMELSRKELGDYTKPAFDASRPAPLKAPKGNVEFEVENIEVHGTLAACRVIAKVDGKRVNSRTVNLKVEQAPNAVKIRVGDVVTVRVVKKGLSVETKGRVRSIDSTGAKASVEVEPSKSTVYGKVLADGTVEVQA